MKQNLQIRELFASFDSLQKTYGDVNLSPVYGAGETKHPNALLVFLNPTAKNISSKLDWPGLRAPWLGTKNVWKMFYELSMISDKTFRLIKTSKSKDWSPSFCKNLYREVANAGVYITNLAKCTQNDARPLKNIVFKKYLPVTLEEIRRIDPCNIVSFGNQVSSVLLGKSVSVSKYLNADYEMIKIKGKKYKLFPVCYPVGQGIRNIDKAIFRMKRVLSEQK